MAFTGQTRAQMAQLESSCAPATDQVVRDATAWFGMMAPAGTPQPIIEKINAETRQFAASPDVRQKLEGLGLQLVGNSPAEFAKIVHDEIPAWGTVIRKAGIKAAAE